MKEKKPIAGILLEFWYPKSLSGAADMEDLSGNIKKDALHYLAMAFCLRLSVKESEPIAGARTSLSNICIIIT